MKCTHLDFQVPHFTPERCVQVSVLRLCEQDRRVLLVLEDLWPSTERCILGALNFATHFHESIDGSRLIVTTWSRSTLSFGAAVPGATEMHELQVFEPDLLGDEAAPDL